MTTDLKINKSRLFKRSWYLFKQGYNGTFSDCLKLVWAEMKEFRAKRIREIELSNLPKTSLTRPETDPVAMANYLTEFYNSNCYKGD